MRNSSLVISVGGSKSLYLLEVEYETSEDREEVVEEPFIEVETKVEK